jgi:micrococcal nuclease
VKYWSSIILVILLLPLVTANTVTSGEYKATRVLDGDTIKVRGASGEITIRLVGIDAPEVSHKKLEPGQLFSQQATKHLAGLVLNKTVDLKEYGRDRCARVLGVVSLGAKNINLEMLEAGFAEGYRGDLAPGQDLALYWKAEEQAKAAKKGMWALGDKYVSQREWRRMRRG